MMTATAIQIDASAIRRTIADQAWRLDNLYFITNKDGKKIPFRMNWAQKAFFDEIHCNNLILKARQLGFSTFINLLQLDTSLFVPNTSCGVIAHNDDAAKELFRDNVKFPYDNLPDGVKSLSPAITDSAHQYRFKNGSSIRVATSMRSGTIQILHVSEFGKICAQFPHRAREIVTGSLETVGAGNLVIIESTAEGNDGYFYDYTQAAKAISDAGKAPGRADYRFFFFPWWKEPTYRLADPQILSPSLLEYFGKVEAEIGVKLDQEQRNWYASKRAKLGDDCFREYPSTADEAFNVSIEGAYYIQQISKARQDGRIGKVPIDPRAPINTFWDIGIDDFTAIWVHQHIGKAHHFVGYHEGSGEPLQYYASLILDKYKKPGVVMGSHYFPHDAAKRDPKDGRTYADEAEKLGLNPLKVVQTPDLLKGIQDVRDGLATAHFDEENCMQGIARLSAYRKDWNDRMGCFSNRPRHDDNSHGADALRMWAQGYKPASTSNPQSRPSAAGWT